MDKQLAEFYGTNVPDETDVEKLAAAEAAEVLAGEDGVDLEGKSDEELEALAQEVLDGAEEGATEEEPAEVEEPEEAAQQKVAEADYLGRVMAHSFVHESKEIEKEAAAKAAEEEEKAKKASPKLKVASHGKVMAHLKGKTKKSGAMPPAFMKGKDEKKDEEKGEKKEDKKEKKSSAMDQLVQARVVEILEANGIDPAELAEKKSAADPKAALHAKVEEQAFAALQEMGFEFEE